MALEAFQTRPRTRHHRTQRQARIQRGSSEQPPFPLAQHRHEQHCYPCQPQSLDGEIHAHRQHRTLQRLVCARRPNGNLLRSDHFTRLQQGACFHLLPNTSNPTLSGRVILSAPYKKRPVLEHLQAQTSPGAPQVEHIFFGAGIPRLQAVATATAPIRPPKPFA